MKKNFKYYKTIEQLPIYNFIQIMKSNSPAVEFLQIFDPKEEPPQINNDQKNELLIAWQNIIYQMKDLQVDTYEAFVEWNLKTLEFEKDLSKNRLTIFRNEYYKEKTKLITIKYLPVVNAFKKYIETLENYFTDFEIEEYRPVENISTKVKSFLNIENKQIDKLDNIKAFYTIDEYYSFIDENCPNYAELFKTKQFFDAFFEQKIITLDKISDIDTYLLDVYKKMNKFNDYIIFRTLYFNMFDLKMKPKIQSENDIYNDIIELRYFTKQHINIETSTVAELIALRQFATKRSDQIAKANLKTDTII